MHAVVVNLTLSGEATDPTALREQVVPRVSQLPSFVAGYWARGGDAGVSIVGFDSEDNARVASEQAPSLWRLLSRADRQSRLSASPR
jgi:hypothetical protein